MIYKVTRVCLYADVSLAEIDFSNAPSFDQYDIHQYDKLRGFLRGNTALKGKHFPERCSQEAWKSAFTGNECGINDIALTGSLQFSEKPISLFKFQLQPIKVDLSHRLGRRMGNHRFLELELPLLSGRNLPKTLGGLGERGREIVVEWLVDTSHALFGRTWKPFFTTKLKKKKRESTQSSETANRVYFFAIDGNGFEISMDSFHKHGFGYFTMSIDRLLNLIRPTRKNKNQSYLKLFSRTSLGTCISFNPLLLFQGRN